LGGFVKKALLEAVYEYLLVTMPVGLYVLLEAVHKNWYGYFFLSPEWSIATIFLAFQGVSLYIRGAKNLAAKISPAAMGIIALAAVLIIIFASINAYQSLAHQTAMLVTARMILFAATSIVFVLLVGGGRFAVETQRRDNGSAAKISG
jgi:hypothetical protein